MTSIYVDVISFPDVGQFWAFFIRVLRSFWRFDKSKRNH